MANTNANTSWRAKWFQANLAETLKNALVAEKICDVNRTDDKYIWNPYGSAPTVTQQSLAGGSQGTYSVSTYTSTDDTLTVTEEFVVSEHIYDFEKVMQRGDIMMSRLDEMIGAMATAIDKYVLNALCEDGTGTYTTPAGGFTTAANIIPILSNLASKFAGYRNVENGYYLVIENTDLPGFMQAQVGTGFNFADSALNNGFLSSYMGFDIYVVRSGTFVDDTLGSKTVTNNGHRVAGIKGLTTYAQPREISYDEKGVTGKTGKEVVAVAYSGFKAWYQKKSLTIDITIA